MLKQPAPFEVVLVHDVGLGREPENCAVVTRAANRSGSVKALIGTESEASRRFDRTEVLKDGEVCSLETDFEGGAILAARALAFRRAGEASAGRLSDHWISRAGRIAGSAKIEDHLARRQRVLSMGNAVLV